MKNHFILTFLLLLSIKIFSQEITLKAKYGSDNKELMNVLTFEGIDYHKVEFTHKELKNKHFKIFVKHIWEGKITKIDTLIDTQKHFGQSIIENETLSFDVLAKKIKEDKLKIDFKFNKFENTKIYDATPSFDYSFRLLADKTKIEFKKVFPLFAYILPYEKNGWKFYCAVDSSGKNVENWGKEFGIKHYIIYEMIFDK